MDLVRRFFRSPEGSFFLFGPRGTGKSTWLRTLYPDACFVDLLDPETFRLYSAAPERLRSTMEGWQASKRVVVDEIQKAAILLDVIHQLIEEKKGWQFIMTGSSARKLKRAGIDLLAGRALRTTMHAFMAAELGEAFDLNTALHLGMLPVVRAAQNPEQTLRAYVSLYLREEVQTEGLVRDLGQFARFVEAISFSHGAALNTSAVARECQVNRKTVDGFVSILEDLLLAFRLPVFTKRAARHLVQHPKFYYFDAGVFRSVRPAGPLDAPGEIAGLSLEGLVAQQVRAWIGYGNEDHALHYWHTKSGREVDFVIYGPRVFLAVEVKNSRLVHDVDVNGLRAFREDYPEAQVCLLYRGKGRLNVRDVLCIPCEEFLLRLTPGARIALS